ncbi:chromate resistance protein [Sphingomonas sp. JC676]|uniref:chromate resistance protein ChrB domain-containing protein n=1 Tax=Sphingomonas sp. JC676 TaxID=2768065 RepID=UPI0016582FE9|nr:sulfurtransferase/chromate resistance protein [Sphingomonas sp. JC676]MBC9032837.1 chromate resistance protein [Sphingomonas sp. JC676]
MPAINAIAPDKLVRLLGTPRAPVILDIRSDVAFAAEPRLIPGAIRRPFADLADWAPEFADAAVVVACEDGGAMGHGTAAWLREAGADADVLDGGIRGWAATGLPMFDTTALPARDAAGRTLWVTRARPKVDRIACPWLIRRFVDPHAKFLFVPAPEVAGVAQQMGATPFDIEADGLRWTHDGQRCTFDVMVEGFGLGGIDGLQRLALIVRGADTARPDIVPEAAGLLAISLGLSRLYTDDLEQLEAGIAIYDALYRWCRDATDETHDWTSHKPAKSRVPA